MFNACMYSVYVHSWKGLLPQFNSLPLHQTPKLHVCTNHKVLRIWKDTHFAGMTTCMYSVLRSQNTAYSNSSSIIFSYVIHNERWTWLTCKPLKRQCSGCVYLCIFSQWHQIQLPRATELPAHILKREKQTNITNWKYCSVGFIQTVMH